MTSDGGDWADLFDKIYPPDLHRWPDPKTSFQPYTCERCFLWGKLQDPESLVTNQAGLTY